MLAKVKSLSETHRRFCDLSRMFSTTAEHLAVGIYKLKCLMNYTSGRDVMTTGYIILTTVTLCQSAERIQNYFFPRMACPNKVEIACVATS